MCKFILLITFLIGIISLNAQDVIVLRDTSEIESKILEINDTNLRYKNWDNPDGPIYNIPKEKILFIRFANGTKEGFDNNAEYERKNIEMHYNERPFVKKPCFQGYIYAEYYIGKFMKGINLSICTGSRINDYVFVGLKSGFCFLLDIKQVLIPVNIDLNIYCPINKTIHPLIHISQGIEINYGSPIEDYSYNYIGHKSRIIYSGKIGVGFDIKVFSICLGWYRFASYNNLYIGIGINTSWKSQNQ